MVQGANDPRVNRLESEQIVIALRDRGFPIEYLLAPDEGHGFRRPVNSMAMFMAAERFLARHLGGRFQEGGTPDVVQRLEEIRSGPRNLDSGLSEISIVFQAAVPKPVVPKYTTSGVRRPSEL